MLHAGIGAITEADVTLALTSPNDTLVVGFNVTADDAALQLAEERGISLREYQIIYNLVDDVKAALEGRLKPIEEVVHLGRAVIRETFKVGKVGTIAGCYVTSGTIERSAPGSASSARAWWSSRRPRRWSGSTASSGSRTTSRKSARASSAA